MGEVAQDERERHIVLDHQDEPHAGRELIAIVRDGGGRKRGGDRGRDGGGARPRGPGMTGRRFSGGSFRLEMPA